MKVGIDVDIPMSFIDLMEVVRIMEEALDSVTSVELEHVLPVIPPTDVFAYILYENEEEVIEYIGVVNEILFDNLGFCVSMPILPNESDDENDIKLDISNNFILTEYSSNYDEEFWEDAK